MPLRPVCLSVLALVFIIGALCIGAPSAHSRETETKYAKIGGWDINYKEFDTENGCNAYASYKDGTIIQLVLIQHDVGKEWVLFISSPQWDRWVSRAAEHRLSVMTTKPWHGVFYVADDKRTLILPDASIAFMNSLADAHSLMIFNDHGQPLLARPLDMKDSEDAIKAVVNCVRAHSFNPPQIPAEETAFFGTAFFIAPNTLLTNDHVVRGCTKAIHVRYPDRASYDAFISGLDETNDLALLHTDMPNLSVAAFHLQPRLGQAVAAYGFPYAGVLPSSGNFTLGNVTSLTGMRDDSRFLRISTPIQPGNSGGPLLDMSGSVVGVVVAQLNALAVMQADQSVPQNVNFAIQSPIVINFLSVKEVTPKLDTVHTGQALAPADVAEVAKQFTVQVYCEGVSKKTSETGRKPSDANFKIMSR